ncbi:hypothetical protein SPRG_19630 [Saprolegnia parasitica CBS 223.65]|uniref:Uncharacterized protein n=1 Tax=Saprolegnia parasitica (strain CBS 223.65) TaxID=695850 RepID=A0A067CL05_SAPPC|nr:hypothetical protein SPRG_19630 [Saprolegnia parasitica CBS 223.65]KDO31173.1 hypothetical protein SPRG_19630 [Saprolegnia parasitica CBS 223.65]|eukprot:XP_012198353.1 hypothetical protein SPRG_19630 [Saprolegnia parasitica CBS 223.65]
MRAYSGLWSTTKTLTPRSATARSWLWNSARIASTSAKLCSLHAAPSYKQQVGGWLAGSSFGAPGLRYCTQCTTKSTTVGLSVLSISMFWANSGRHGSIARPQRVLKTIVGNGVLATILSSKSCAKRGLDMSP